jgi:hypothetical protein
VGEGYSLRYVFVEALLAYRKDEGELYELSSVLEQMQEFILSFDNQLALHPSGEEVSLLFLDSVKQSARLGLSVE